eukprot:jgi/Tetstr1/440177/TSEL_028529.t2
MSRVPRPRRADELPLQRKCTLGCPVIDQLLRGGVATGVVTEVFGEATAGKTQFCLQLLLTSQWPEVAGGLGGTAVYIFTEGQPPLRRLSALVSRHVGWNGTHHQPSATDRILVENKVESLQDLQVCLRKILVMLYRKTSPVKLVVIDSIANLARDACELRDLTQRSQQMFQVSALMKEIASKYQVAVVVANQVVANINDIGSRNAKLWHPSLPQSSGKHVLPALGLAWANCVDTRLFFCRLDDAGAHGQHGAGGRRLQVVYSPNLAPSYCHYEISESGLRGIPDSVTY